MEHEEVANQNSVIGRGKIAENCVEYYLFIIDQQLDNTTHTQSLEAVRKAATELCQSLAKSYIWQRDEFSVELKISHGLMFLYGITDYGEAIEDEWLIVYMLRELTKSFPSLWIRVADTDGEFLLIEAANTLPDWINPEVDENRVWLHQSKLYIIPMLDKNHDQNDDNVGKISLRHAVDHLRHQPNTLLHSAPIEREAFYRLQKYPDFVKTSSHFSLVTVPRKLAYILHTNPKSIAMAIEMFYLRDAISLQPIMSKSSQLVFPPDDLVTISVQFSKILFAQLRSQRFEPPHRWRHLFPIPSHSPAFASAQNSSSQLDLGMKTTIGYEMLARIANKSKHRVVRELDIILQDLAEDGDDALPTDRDMEDWQDNKRHDDDRWLDIDFSEFERQLEGRQSRRPEEAPPGLNDVDTQIDLKKIVSRFETFLNDEKADTDGVNFDTMDDDDDEDDDNDDEALTNLDGEKCSEYETVELNEGAFAQIMRDMMSLPHDVAAGAADDAPCELNDSSPSVSIENQVESNELQQLAAQLEAELKQHGALSLTPGDDLQGLERNHWQAQDGQSQSGVRSNNATDDDVVNVDYHLAKNILESFKSQAGMAGPASNLLGMMGLTLPRDEAD
ncbi:hypothetical protein C2857_002970 [Epichloe festucae Fl1]|uniref:Uncharacterized protein n=1 Tax=Epichloe festucae (strain Fl1) TaxID=877507 RepID=A0A7S9PS00_EPIFF|nr:hypothetical protein C2857_002970 [Epichloe festucae Fl1]